MTALTRMTGNPDVHDAACEGDFGAEGQESPCRCAEREPSAEAVQAAARADFEYGKESMTWDDWVEADPDHAAWCLRKARAVLRAAAVHRERTDGVDSDAQRHPRCLPVQG